MSKYNALWDYVRSQSAPQLTLTFDEIQQIAGIPITIRSCNIRRNWRHTAGKSRKSP